MAAAGTRGRCVLLCWPTRAGSHYNTGQARTTTTSGNVCVYIFPASCCQTNTAVKPQIATVWTTCIALPVVLKLVSINN